MYNMYVKLYEQQNNECVIIYLLIFGLRDQCKFDREVKLKAMKYG